MFKILHFFRTIFMFTTYYPMTNLADFTIEKKKEGFSKIQSNFLKYSNCHLYRVSKNKINH